MKVVEPVVEVQPQELVSCSHGLRALVDAVEARVLADLQSGFAALFVQARRRVWPRHLPSYAANAASDFSVLTMSGPLRVQ